MALFALSAHADSQSEINHLLAFVAQTSCTYERNGSFHNGREAVAHIKKKYRYFADDIKSAEDFIHYSASKSTFSGKHYTIHCPEQKPIKSQTWLLNELTRYRHSLKAK
ncbi:hypothetical protein EMK97_10065 [Litorilituus sediminis]|uniref:DUF5329 domain-containing protein n=2 Tax=Litorilituus sediminis TaxID=718192 RepID=A0A4P6P866_9GAMM|nr:hypothetical protein EMK97_10065 [Litorilituus sediminis]